MASEELFFARLGAELSSYEKFMAIHAPAITPDFNFFSVVYPNENRLSSVIAMLLDPNGEHAQGDLYLKEFIRLVVSNSPNDLSHVFYDIINKKCRRELEVSTVNIKNKQRRIDILLNFEGFNLAIENKPWTIDQDKQIEDYLEELRERNKGCCKGFLLIYISGYNDIPDNKSISRENMEQALSSCELVISNYLMIYEWVGLCIEKTKSYKVKIFLEDFQLYIKREFCGGLPMPSEKIVVENAIKPENISCAISVVSAWPEIAKKLIEKLMDKVASEIDIDNKELWDRKCNFDIYKKDCGFEFWKNTWKNYRLCVRFDYTNANGLCYGIVKIRRECKDFPTGKISALCIDAGLGGGEESDWWPWYKECESPYLNWGLKCEVWSGITEGGNTVKYIADRIKLVKNAVEKAVDEQEWGLALDEIGA